MSAVAWWFWGRRWPLTWKKAAPIIRARVLHVPALWPLQSSRWVRLIHVQWCTWLELCFSNAQKIAHNIRYFTECESGNKVNRFSFCISKPLILFRELCWAVLLMWNDIGDLLCGIQPTEWPSLIRHCPTVYKNIRWPSGTHSVHPSKFTLSSFFLC